MNIPLSRLQLDGPVSLRDLADPRKRQRLCAGAFAIEADPRKDIQGFGEKETVQVPDFLNRQL